MSGGRPEGRPDSGVVLIEVLAALSIVAVMMGLLAGFLGQLRAVADLREAVSVRAELSAAAGHLQQTLAAAKAAPLPGGESEPETETGTEVVFEGGAAGMRFAAVTRRGFQSLALRDVRIATESIGGKRALVQSLAARRPATDTPGPDPAEFVILDDVSGVRFDYADASGAFASSWQSDELPTAVRITLSRVSGGRTVSVQALARTR